MTLLDILEHKIKQSESLKNYLQTIKGLLGQITLSHLLMTSTTLTFIATSLNERRIGYISSIAWLISVLWIAIKLNQAISSKVDIKVKNLWLSIIALIALAYIFRETQTSYYFLVMLVIVAWFTINITVDSYNELKKEIATELKSNTMDQMKGVH